MLATDTSLTDLSSAFQGKDLHSLTDPMMALASQLRRTENKQGLLTRIAEHIAEGLEQNPLRVTPNRLPEGLTVPDMREAMKSQADNDTAGTERFRQKFAPLAQQFDALATDQMTLLGLLSRATAFLGGQSGMHRIEIDQPVLGRLLLSTFDTVLPDFYTPEIFKSLKDIKFRFDYPPNFIERDRYLAGMVALRMRTEFGDAVTEIGQTPRLVEIVSGVLQIPKPTVKFASSESVGERGEWKQFIHANNTIILPSDVENVAGMVRLAIEGVRLAAIVQTIELGRESRSAGTNPRSTTEMGRIKVPDHLLWCSELFQISVGMLSACTSEEREELFHNQDTTRFAREVLEECAELQSGVAARMRT